MITVIAATTGYLFWAAVFVVLVVDIVFLSNDDCEIQATFWTVAALVATYLFTDAFTGVRWPIVIMAVLAYLAVGVIWSFWKWYSYVVNKLDTLKVVWSSNKPSTGTFAEYIKGKQPYAVYNKSRITGWMALWPFSLTWWVMTWPRRFFTWAYKRLSTVFDRMSDKIWNAQ